MLKGIVKAKYTGEERLEKLIRSMTGGELNYTK